MPPDKDLDRELRDLGPRVEYPPTPDIAGSVRGRLEAETNGAGSPPRSRPRLWWIAAAALVLLVSVPVFSLALRDTGGVFSAGGDAAGGAAEGGGRGSGAEPARPTEDAAAGPTHSAEKKGGLAVGAGSSAAAGSAEAACGFPASSLRIRPEKGAPGTGFVLRGENFVDRTSARSSCDDTPPSSEPSDAGSRLAPPREVRLDFRQGQRTWKLGVVRPGEALNFRVRLQVPEDARPETATITATGEGVLDPSKTKFELSQK